MSYSGNFHFGSLFFNSFVNFKSETDIFTENKICESRVEKQTSEE